MNETKLFLALFGIIRLTELYKSIWSEFLTIQKKMRPIWNNLFVWHKTVHRELIFKHPLMSNIIIDASHFYKLAPPLLNSIILKTIKILSLTFKVNTLFLRKLTCNHHCIYYQAILSPNGLAPCKTL